MESLIQEAYEQIPVYLRNGRDMNRKEEQAGGLEDYPVLERNQLIEEETAVLMPWAEMLRMLSGPGKIITDPCCHCGFIVISIMESGRMTGYATSTR